MNAGRRDWLSNLQACVIYGACAWLFIDHGVSITRDIFGSDTDPYAYIWFLAWLPWALSHHLDPLWTHLVWQPLGLSLAWTASIPLIALAAIPLEVWGTPVLAYNCLVLAAPVLSAWCMFRLCRRITPGLGAALIGGYIYGFSTYEMTQVVRLNLSFTFLLPCFAGIVLSRMEGKMRRRVAAGLMTLCLAGQFLISTEITAMCVFFGGLIWLSAYVILDDRRGPLRLVLGDVIIAGGLALLLLSPVLVMMFRIFPFVQVPALWPEAFSASLTDFFVPGQFSFFSLPSFWRLTNGFAGEFEEQNTYVGLPLLAICYVYARNNWHLKTARWLVLALPIVDVLALGPHLWIGQRLTAIPLPWAIFAKLPLLSNALPVRFALQASFFSAIIAALWLADAGRRGLAYKQVALGLLACITIIPAPYGYAAVPRSDFFAPGRLQAVLGDHAQLLVLPFGSSGPSSYWQVENRFGFSQTGGYLGFPPLRMARFAAIRALTRGGALLNAADIGYFAQATKADYIVAGPGTPAAEIAVIETLRWRERKVDDVTIFDVPAAGSKGG